MAWHQLSGTILLGLLTFRIFWGFVGSRSARFADFVHTPGRVLAYLRRPPATMPDGHNPLGGYAVMAMLMLLAVQIGSGLFAVDIDGIESGALSYLVSFDAGRAAAAAHHLSFNILLGLAALHLAAIAYYALVKRQPLIRRMVTGGHAALEDDTDPQLPALGLRFPLAAGAAALCAWWVGNGMPL
jgi:cytochrome b